MIIAQRRVQKTNERPAIRRSAGKARIALEALRAYADRNPMEDNLQGIQDLERSIKHSELYANFLNHPITREIVLTLLKNIEAINADILSGKKTQSKDMIRRDEWKAMLNIFDPNRASDAGIASHIDYQIKRFREYYGD